MNLTDIQITDAKTARFLEFWYKLMSFILIFEWIVLSYSATEIEEEMEESEKIITISELLQSRRR